MAGTNNAKHFGTSFPSGKVSLATRFDGVNDYVRVADGAAGSDFGTGAFTIAFWIKAGPQTGLFSSCILSKSKFGLNGRYNVGLQSSGELSLGLEYDQTFFGYVISSIGANFDDNSWHLAAVTVQPGSPGSTSVTWYKDGAFNRSSSPLLKLEGSISNNTDLLIGACEPDSSLSSFFTGELDEVLFFNRILTQSEIQAIYDADSAGLCGCRTC